MLQTRQDYASLLRLCAFILTQIGNKGAMLLQKPPVRCAVKQPATQSAAFSIVTHSQITQTGRRCVNTVHAIYFLL